jgi:hypothetical protein
MLSVALGAVVMALLSCTPALALNPERHYEMVSPPFKGGFGALGIEGVASDGESVAYYSPGVFAGAPTGPFQPDYLARRGATGWSTRPLLPPASLLSLVRGVDLSPSLDSVLVHGQPGPSSENPLPIEDYFVHEPSSPDTEAGWGSPFAEVKTEEISSIEEMDADPSFCHILLQSFEYPLLPEGNGDQLYELNRGCGTETRGLAFVGVNNQDSLINRDCGVDGGVRKYALNGENTFNAVNVDGSETFFTDCLSDSSTVPSSPHQLFVRLGGSRTVEVSRPLVEEGSKNRFCGEVPCEEAARRGSAEFQGASEDGSRVFFTAPLKAGQAPLVPGDTDASDNLYMAGIGCPEGTPECGASEREVRGLAEVSHDPNGGAADVQGVLRVAPDGQRAYFVAEGDLLTGAQQQALEGEDRMVPHVGAENLYVYDNGGEEAEGSIQFIGDLCSGHELSGSVQDVRCPASGSDESLWTTNFAEAQTAAADGRFLVFATYAQLTGEDTNAARDVYRYDASTGVLERISGGEGGYDANGNGGALGSTIMAGNHGDGQFGKPVRSQFEMNDRAISEDGSRIVFLSAEPLSPMVTNGLTNAYEWRESADGVGGSVSLVSSGTGEQPVEDAVVSPDGRNIFFDTTVGLVPQDTDGAPDIYDARLGEGFPASSTGELRPCEGDACQGPLTTPAPLLVPGSIAQAPGGNYSSPSPTKASSGKHKPKKKKKKGKAKRARRAGKASRSRTVAGTHTSTIAGRGR